MGIKSINLLESAIPELVLPYDVFILKPFGATMHNIQDVCEHSSVTGYSIM